MKKIWLLLIVIVLGGCKMSSDTNEETEEITLTEEEKQDIKENWRELEIGLYNETDEKIKITLSDDFVFWDYTRSREIKSGKHFDGRVHARKEKFELSDFATSTGTKKAMIMTVNCYEIS